MLEEKKKTIKKQRAEDIIRISVKYWQKSVLPISEILRFIGIMLVITNIMPELIKRGNYAGGQTECQKRQKNLF